MVADHRVAAGDQLDEYIELVGRYSRRMLNLLKCTDEARGVKSSSWAILRVCQIKSMCRYCLLALVSLLLNLNKGSNISHSQHGSSISSQASLTDGSCHDFIAT